MKPVYADVLLQIDVPTLPQPLTYRLRDGLTLAVGDAVLVPLGPQSVVGYVVGLKDECPPEMTARIKPVTAKIENAAGFDEELCELARWTAEQTLCEWRDALKLIAPDVMVSQVKTTWTLADEWEEKLTGTRSAAQRDAATALAALGGTATPLRLTKSLPGVKLAPAVAELRKKGVVTETRTVSVPQARAKVVRLLKLAVDGEIAAVEAERLANSGAPRQARLLRALLEVEDKNAAMPSAGLAVGSSARTAAQALADKGLAVYVEAAVRRDPFRFFGFVETKPPPLTDAQAEAALTIGRHLSEQDGRTILLHGVTGSGKTEVYLDAVARALALEKNALLLLPEIALTAQTLDLFKARFGEEDVAVLHSALSPGERHDEWRRIQTGAARVVVGARSAVFAPVPNLGLIVLDEEHDGSYKQDSVPRYHARDVARRRAETTGAVVLLGSATPSLESFWSAQSGDYELVTLAKRISDRPLPPVEIVDLRAEMKAFQAPTPASFAPTPASPPLPRAAGEGPVTSSPTLRQAAEELLTGPSPAARGRGGEAGVGAKEAGAKAERPEKPLSVLGQTLSDALADRLEKRQQAILFLNRRGFASFLLCRDCGFTFRCPNCDVSLTYHHAARLLQCHHCDHRRRAPDLCPTCGGLRLRPFGLGTERVEEAVRKLLPEAKTLRMDRDTMARKGAHADALRLFKRGEADILIGTQMVAKGLDFPNVTLVGVVSADTALNIPDFRSAERAFQLLTQVAGRAGRGKTPGEVIVQTFTPEHESVIRAASHDYLGFYADAIEQRRELSYPPFAHLANCVFADENETQAQSRCERLADVLRAEISGGSSQILGPVACPLSRLRGRFRWHLVLRCRKKAQILTLLRAALARLTSSERAGLSLDIDPLTML